jgi:hypothetical protein
MIATIIECAVGFGLAAVALRDVFDTVVVPGRARGSLKISRHLVLVGLPLWKRVRHRGIGVNFAPVVLLMSFVTWMLLLVLGFGLMMHALRDWFAPALGGFGESLYVAGSALATIGLGDSDAYGPAAAVVVGAGFCGLAVMTMAVTYLLEVQSNIARRDTGVLKLSTFSGHPPSALGLLERYAELGCRDALVGVLREGREWCAEVLQSHSTHPFLIYFRSAGTGAGWPASLGTLADLALIIEFLLDDPGARGAAALLRQQAHRLAHDLAAVLELAPATLSTSCRDVDALCGRLRAAGYRLRDHPDRPGFIAARSAEVGRVQVLSQHLGTPEAPLLPPGGHSPPPRAGPAEGIT